MLEVGDFLVDVQRHEVTLQGQPVKLARQVFDLLVFLAQRQDGSIARQDEIRQALWRGRVVSPGALGQAILQLRRVLKQSVNDPVQLEAVRGVGYRLLMPQRATRASVSQRSAGGQRPVVVLLPCVNATGGPDFDWVGSGLTELMADAIGRAGASQVHIWRGAPGGSGLFDQSATGSTLSRFVVELSLGQQDGLCWLDCRLTDTRLPLGCGTRVESLSGTDPLELGLRTARRLVFLLTMGEPEALIYPWRDPWANLTLARALHLMSVQDYRQAVAMLRALHQCAAPHPWATLALMQALAPDSPQEVPALGDGLLALPNLPVDMQALAHALIARTCRGDLHKRSEVHAAAAIRCAAARAPSTWILLALRSLGQLAWHRFESQGCPPDSADAVVEVFNRIEKMAEACEQAEDMARALSSLGALHFVRQELNASRDCYMRSIAANTRAGLQPLAAIEEASLSMVHWLQGDLASATARAMAALKVLETQSPQRRRLSVLGGIALLVSETGDTALMARLQALIARWLSHPESADHASLQAALAVGRWLQGQHAAAISSIVSILQSQAVRHGGVIFQRLWAQWLLRAGCVTGQVPELLRSLAGLPDWPAMCLCPEMRRVLQHAEAAERLRGGDRRGCVYRLRELVSEVSGGEFSREQSLALLDLSWLLLDARDVAGAQAMLDRLGTQYSQHPAGQAARARLHEAQGRDAEAWPARRRALAMLAWGPPAWALDPMPPVLLSDASVPGDWFTS